MPVAFCTVGHKQAHLGPSCSWVLHIDNEDRLDLASGIIDVLDRLPLDVGRSLALRDLAHDRRKSVRIAAHNVGVGDLQHLTHSVADCGVMDGRNQRNDLGLYVEFEAFLDERVQ